MAERLDIYNIYDYLTEEEITKGLREVLEELDIEEGELSLQS